MTDPVIAADGITYNRSTISRWLLTHDTSPLLNTRMPHSALRPNEPLRMYVQQYLAGGGR